jgi:hypothetical protein
MLSEIHAYLKRGHARFGCCGAVICGCAGLEYGNDPLQMSFSIRSRSLAKLFSHCNDNTHTQYNEQTVPVCEECFQYPL